VEETKKIGQKILKSYAFIRPLFLKIFRKFFKHFSHLKVEGLENLPSEGPFILAPNHESHLDNLFVACFLPKKMQKNMAVIGKKEHFDRFITRWAAKLCHAIPVDRNQVSNISLQICANILHDGHVILIHPEGTRSPDGNILPFKSGVAILADHINCPVVPVYIEGAHEFWPKDSLLPKSRSHITVIIGKPLYPKSVNPNETILDGAFEADEFTAKLRNCVLELGER